MTNDSPAHDQVRLDHRKLTFAGRQTAAIQMPSPGWPAPKGYSNGRIGVGKAVHVGGQIGWNTAGVFRA